MLLTRTDAVWGYYRIRASSISMQNREALLEFKENWSKFTEEMIPYGSLHLWMYPQDAQLAQRFSDLENDLAEDSVDVAEYYNEEAVHILKERLESLTKYDFIIGIKMRSDVVSLERSVKENVTSLLSRVNTQVMNTLKLERTIYDDAFLQYQEQEDVLANAVLAVQGIRLTEAEMVYMNRFGFIRGMEHEVATVSADMDIESITNTVIDPTFHRAMQLTAPEGESFVTSLTVDEFLDNMAETDLFYELQKMPFPVEVNIKAAAEKKTTTKTALGFKKEQLHDKAGEKMELGDNVDKDILRSSSLAQHLKEELKKEHTALWNWIGIITVTGKTKKESLQRARMVRSQLKNLDIKAKIPVADQIDLFYRALPGFELDLLDKNWQQKTLQDGLAENLFGVNAEMGSKIGFFIGWVDRFSKHLDLQNAIASSRDFVLFHPFLANKQIAASKTKSPHILISGDTGGGKAFLAKLLYIYCCFLAIRLLYVDPKREMRKWINKVIADEEIQEKFPLFIDLLKSIQFVTLDASNPDNWGALDPVVLYDAHSTDGKEMIQVTFEQIYQFKNDIVETVFLRAITEVRERRAEGETVGSMHIIEILQASEIEEVRQAGDLLYEKTQDSILKLMIHDGSNPALSLNQTRTILEVANLDLPKAGDSPEHYTKPQREASAVMFGLGRYSELFGMNPEEATMVFVDESWMYNATPQGQKVKNSMLRVGRSQDNAFVSITQGVKDEKRANFGVAFAFDEPTEREEVLEWVGMEPSKENITMMKDFYQGQCFFKDYYGRTGKLSVECLFDEWMGALQTVKKSQTAYAEEKYL